MANMAGNDFAVLMQSGDLYAGKRRMTIRPYRGPLARPGDVLNRTGQRCNMILPGRQRGRPKRMKWNRTNSFV
jgi:hypothetical protein